MPLAYLITFTCYGTRVHGDESGSVDRKHNLPGSDFLPPNPPWVSAERKQMKQSPYELEGRRRALVLEAIQEVCSRREWMLLAVHVRTHHVHAVVAAPETPEKVMNGMKTYGSRALNQSGLDRVSCRRWAHHGSTRYLWKPEDVASAMEYVVRGQGEPMAVWENPDRPSW
ncbi:MAG: transposase [Acidobacteria bacterium]|nr:transposase [Acidobacteriota bacterium]